MLGYPRRFLRLLKEGNKTVDLVTLQKEQIQYLSNEVSGLRTIVRHLAAEIILISTVYC